MAYDDLALGLKRQRVPLVSGRAGRRDICVHDRVRAAGELPREVDVVGLHAVADERRHGHATMLDLSVAEPADGLLEVVLRLIEDAERICGAHTTRLQYTCKLRRMRDAAVQATEGYLRTPVSDHGV